MSGYRKRTHIKRPFSISFNCCRKLSKIILKGPMHNLFFYYCTGLEVQLLPAVHGWDNLLRCLAHCLHKLNNPKRCLSLLQCLALYQLTFHMFRVQYLDSTCKPDQFFLLILPESNRWWGAACVSAVLLQSCCISTIISPYFPYYTIISMNLLYKT